MKQLLILAIILVISTFVVILCNPSLKEVRIVNTEYSVKNQDISAVKTKTANIENKNISQNQAVNVNNVSPQVVKQTVNVTNNVQPAVKKVQTVQNVNTTKNVPVKTSNVQQTTAQKTVVKPSAPKQQAQQPVQKPVQTTPKQPVQSAKPAVSTPVKTTVQPSAPVKTAEQVKKEKEAQEAISWNKWRANVHNQIISQVNLPNVPAGTTFTYSFTVTKDGTISNVRTSSVAPQYTAFAIQYIAPVVRRSAHASFLKFPSGTARTVVDVKYTFRTTNSGSGTQASASNFNDVEVVKK